MPDEVTICGVCRAFDCTRGLEDQEGLNRQLDKASLYMGQLGQQLKQKQRATSKERRLQAEQAPGAGGQHHDTVEKLQRQHRWEGIAFAALGHCCPASP